MARASRAVTPSQQLRQHRDEVVALLRERGVENPRIFGSVARGTDSADSDLDLLVTVPPDRAWEFVALPRELSEMLGVKVDVLSDRGLKAKHADILREAIPL